ncbi:PspC domain-containing protein [Candidatus Amesbacteria bacterium RIFCSPHIGHO2_01_FULL_48_32]|uniref:PspC domain-containing protein n=1 Tax=Candidatus Amesbacteria bacterium RIFCSPLOWO2_01_FULL_48_25 TaxID=1797259 RepID=A0A1F4ZAP9_9BACT|nr:MAG: PspC domain-containing protein [Candidatus Amesbacteria bacterium RIFCSPHIGHO2_01_FULL_48_32]OGD03302.1 MAG: PspC domain-containing protein [Candidatus Amesbacteria bacterium RIFCSPLOWO2_01_FULL_48_25]HJZ05251.1 PspC domain-containing protein [Patescibacteria group bacterium]
MADLVKKRLTRGTEKKLVGVCSGIGDYLGVDPVLVRLAWVLITVFTGIFPGLIAYILAAWVMPEKK